MPPSPRGENPPTQPKNNEGPAVSVGMPRVGLETVLRSLTLLAALAFLTAYTFEAAFLLRLGLTFANVPISPADIYRDALICIPYALLMNVYIMFSAVKGAESLATFADEEPQKTKHPRAMTTLLIACILCALGWCWTGKSLHAAATVMCAYIYLTHNFAITNRLARQAFGAYRHLVLISLPMALFSVFAFGDWVAGSRLGTSNDANLHMKGEQGAPTPILVLNSYEKGLLFRGPEGVTFLVWDEISSIVKTADPRTPLCALSDILPLPDNRSICPDDFFPPPTVGLPK